MDISFALFADAANISQEGKLNILGVFDAVQVATFPSVHPRAHLVLRIKGHATDVGTHTVTLRWVNPRGQELWSTTGDLGIAAPPPEVRVMDLPLIAAVDLPLDVAGSYAMHVALDDEAHAEVALQVRVAVQNQAPMGGGMLGGGLVS